MKNRFLLCSLTLALALPLGLLAQAPDAGKEKEPQTELGAKMEKVGGAFRALRRQISDATKNADSLAKVAIIKENLTAASKFEPARKATVPQGEQAKFVAAFQAKLKDTLADVEKLEAALKAGDNAAAAKLADVVNEDQVDAHKNFKKGKKKG